MTEIFQLRKVDIDISMVPFVGATVADGLVPCSLGACRLAICCVNAAIASFCRATVRLSAALPVLDLLTGVL